MSEGGMPFHQCDRCDGIVGLWEEVVGTHPVMGRTLFLHDRCARPDDHAVPITVWLGRKRSAGPLVAPDCRALMAAEVGVSTHDPHTCSLASPPVVPDDYTGHPWEAT